MKINEKESGHGQFIFTSILNVKTYKGASPLMNGPDQTFKICLKEQTNKQIILKHRKYVQNYTF